MSKAIFLRSIQWRLVLILILITFTIMTVFWVFLNFQVESIFYTDYKNDIATNYEALGINEDNTDLELLLQHLQENPVIAGFILGKYKSYTVIDKSSGQIVFSSDQLYQKDKAEFRKAIFKSENLISVLPLKGVDLIGEKQAYTRAANGDFYDYVRT